MAAQNVTPTRSELINVKRKIALSKSGYNLLKKKRDGLMYEVFAILPKVKSIRSDLVKRYQAAQESIQVASAVEGAITVRSVAMTVTHPPQVQLKEHNIMGVKVPKISASSVRHPLSQRGYGLVGTSPAIDEAVGSYEALVEQLILAAELETAIKRLLDEVEKTKRRVNALEFKVLPELEEIRKFIGLRLEEMEREGLFSMKRIKAKSKAKAALA
ncbi:MAG TPA: V-type ATP synthase subunit D [Candidatus Thermoplasmatota archaeon]|jgi:V/A-type H+/Na+-transporting ATPase subunit D|nr:V-type ATP synthase subunit D [Candidatus Thermoplasmatota archaeon]